MNLRLLGLAFALAPFLLPYPSGTALAQAASDDIRTDVATRPSDRATARDLGHASVFADYSAYRDTTLGDWRLLNDAVGGPEPTSPPSAQPSSAPTSPPPQPHRHGESK